MKNTGENVVRIEAEALRALADRIGGPMAGAFARAVELMFSCTCLLYTSPSPRDCS